MGQLCSLPEALLPVLQDYYYSDWSEEEREQGKHMQVRWRRMCCLAPCLRHAFATTAAYSMQATRAACILHDGNCWFAFHCRS